MDIPTQVVTVKTNTKKASDDVKRRTRKQGTGTAKGREGKGREGKRKGSNRQIEIVYICRGQGYAHM
jgi:hypothetical protein